MGDRDRLIEKYKVIHNDIHSGNIMRRRDGSFVLLDFGLAIEGDEVVKSSSRHENGAPEYMPPEKWDNNTVLAEQSDIYSFGIVMYEYLAGRVPFPYDKICSSTEASYKLMKQHKEQQPPKIYDLRKSYFEAKYPGKTYEKDYPDWLEEAVLKCLEKDPTNRFKNGRDLYEFVAKHVNEDNKGGDEAELLELRQDYEVLVAEVETLRKENKALVEQLKQKEMPEEQTPTEKPQAQPVEDVQKVCARCGAVLSPNARFCRKCGKKVR